MGSWVRYRHNRLPGVQGYSWQRSFLGSRLRSSGAGARGTQTIFWLRVGVGGIGARNGSKRSRNGLKNSKMGPKSGESDLYLSAAQAFCATTLGHIQSTIA
jgi:hypothetical protein